MTPFDRLVSLPRKTGPGFGRLCASKDQDAREDPTRTGPELTANRAVVMRFKPHGMPPDTVCINPKWQRNPWVSEFKLGPLGEGLDC